MKNKNKLLNNMTESEKRFEQILKDNKVRYMKQKGFIAKGFSCIVDFYLPEWKCCVEIDGGYHNTDIQKIKDSYRTEYLTKTRNLCVIRIKNEHVSKSNFKKIFKIIKSLERGESINFIPVI